MCGHIRFVCLVTIQMHMHNTCATSNLMCVMRAAIKKTLAMAASLGVGGSELQRVACMMNADAPGSMLWHKQYTVNLISQVSVHCNQSPINHIFSWWLTCHVHLALVGHTNSHSCFTHSWLYFICCVFQ
jgi:hypothetical protein